MKMTTEEVFVIIGSAMMPIFDLFPTAGIKFWDGAHEGNAGMTAGGYSRVTGRMSMAIAQNGPGITNFGTPIKTAYWIHTPLLLVTPQAAACGSKQDVGICTMLTMLRYAYMQKHTGVQIG